MRRIWLLAAFSLALEAGAGELYRWVDEDGRVHFSDRPPVEAKAESLDGQLKPINSADATRKIDFPDSSRAQQIERDYVQRRQAQEARDLHQRQIACNQARRQLEILKGRVYFVDADGNQTTISERERAEKASALDALIHRHCS
ncbi:DUF4124 domain-containing protein [Microbulbifer bruguierae]|uniref:DUF4124 domain-containing protein n=1 Tax=Microbulbifer bruguierae TaxID=3029061 RepID=A0ABY8N9L7_9GAMM|nr:DUF4124 domain-containing protein [Microbulbifer bruguierae]WGL15576.1 DUF4124 domain-containing protein [Microbulbifer bruguierae]